MAAFVLCRLFRSGFEVLRDCSLWELRLVETEKWMISAEGRYCSNRVLMLTRVKGCCHYLEAEGAVTVKCTFTGDNANHTVLLWYKRADIKFTMSFWLFMCKWVNAVDCKCHKSRPLSHWIWSVPLNVLWSVNSFCLWIIKNLSLCVLVLHEIINSSIKLSFAVKHCSHFFPASARAWVAYSWISAVTS